MNSITGNANYYEDFEVGAKLKHERGTTVGEVESQLLTKLVMNTADVHFNEDRAQNSSTSYWSSRKIVSQCPLRAQLAKRS